jgi:hypothetical protein
VAIPANTNMEPQVKDNYADDLLKKQQTFCGPCPKNTNDTQRNVT